MTAHQSTNPAFQYISREINSGIQLIEFYELMLKVNNAIRTRNTQKINSAINNARLKANSIQILKIKYIDNTLLNVMGLKHFLTEYRVRERVNRVKVLSDIIKKSIKSIKKSLIYKFNNNENIQEIDYLTNSLPNSITNSLGALIRNTPLNQSLSLQRIQDTFSSTDVSSILSLKRNQIDIVIFGNIQKKGNDTLILEFHILDIFLNFKLATVKIEGKTGLEMFSLVDKVAEKLSQMLNSYKRGEQFITKTINASLDAITTNDNSLTVEKKMNYINFNEITEEFLNNLTGYRNLKKSKLLLCLKSGIFLEMGKNREKVKSINFPVAILDLNFEFTRNLFLGIELGYSYLKGSSDYSDTMKTHQFFLFLNTGFFIQLNQSNTFRLMPLIGVGFVYQKAKLENSIEIKSGNVLSFSTNTGIGLLIDFSNSFSFKISYDLKIVFDKNALQLYNFIILGVAFYL